MGGGSDVPIGQTSAEKNAEGLRDPELDPEGQKLAEDGVAAPPWDTFPPVSRAPSDGRGDEQQRSAAPRRSV